MELLIRVTVEKVDDDATDSTEDILFDEVESKIKGKRFTVDDEEFEDETEYEVTNVELVDPDDE